MDVELLGVTMNFIFVLQHQVDEKMAVVADRLRFYLSIQSMVK